MLRVHVYSRLLIWQRSLELAGTVHEITCGFPRSELFGLTSQMRRAAVSVPSNIAEGSTHSSRAFRQYLRIALGSLSELETQVRLAANCGYLEESAASSFLEESGEIRRMTIAYLATLS